ncbi:MAG: tetratricopeptide repeat protein, partial [Chlorobi bacterium]|nr:tetratricopeptide repeat protein [Chlorobiota bacterium]
VVLIALIIINSSIEYGCSGEKKVTGSAIKNKERIIKNKGEAEQNFNYLFAEAIKMKENGNYEMAIKYFTACKQIKNDDAVDFQLSQLWAIAGDFDKAKKYGWEAQRLDEKNIWYYYQLANIYQKNNQQDSVIIIYERMVKTFPEEDELKYSLAQAYTKNKKYKKALSVYNKLIEEFGYTKELGLSVEGVYEHMKLYTHAMSECNKLIKLFPEDIVINGLRAELFSKEGKFKEAEKIYKDIITKYPEDSRILFSMAEHYVRKGDNYKLNDILKKIFIKGDLENNQKYGFVLNLLQNIKNDSTNEVIIKSALKWIESNQVDFKIKANFADYLIRERDFSNAIIILRNVTKEKPEIVTAWQQLGIMEEQGGNLDSMRNEMENAIGFHPDDPVLLLLYSTALLQKKKNNEAIEVLEKGYDLVNNNNNKSLELQYLSMLGDAYNTIKEYKKSENYYEKALKIDPESKIVLNNYSYYLSLRKERLGDALKMSKKTIEAEPENSTYLDTYGWVLYNMGRVREAEKYIRKALENHGDESDEILGHYGEILYKNGKIQEAIKYWEKALKINPDNKEIMKRLKDINEKKK